MAAQCSIRITMRTGEKYVYYGDSFRRASSVIYIKKDDYEHEIYNGSDLLSIEFFKGEIKQ